MSSYLVPHLTPTQVDELQAGGVSFYVVDQAQQSYIIEGPDLERALTLLSATATESPSAYTDVIQLALTVHAPLPDAFVNNDDVGVIVETNGSYLPPQSFVDLVGGTLSVHLNGRKIMLHLPPRGDRAKRVRSPIQDGLFHIHLWSSPAGHRRRTPPSYIWNLPVDCRDKCYGLSNQGVPLLDATEEYAVGEMLENNLYIHHDAINSGSSNEYALLQAILERSLPDLNLKQSERVQRIKERNKDGRAESRRLYIKACSIRIKGLVEATRTSLAARFVQLSQSMSQSLVKTRLENFGSESGPDTIRQRASEFAAEFEALKSVARVKSVVAGHSLVMIKTEALFAQHPQTGQSHELGEFMIVIDLNGGRKAVRWFNATRRVEGIRPGMNAPTVYADGSPILDEIQETMIELIARLQLSVVAELAIQFVETINNDLPGAQLVKWPLAR